MFKRFPGKSPTQMRREREGRRPSSPPPGPVDPARRPPLHRDTADQIAATADWLAHIAAGRIQVR
jgi:hypothetical protein